MIEIIAGTNRPGSNTLKVAKIILGKYHTLGAEAQLLSLEEMPQEIFNPSSYGEKPVSFAPIQERILNARGLHLVTPEYNGSFPGVLKYFIDMLKFPESFEHRCVAYTGVAAGIWGAFRSVEQIQMIFGYRNAYNLPERVWIPGINKKLSEDEKTITDELIDQHLDKQCREFVEFVRRNAG